MKNVEIRLIQLKDNQAVKELVVNTLAEFGISGAGFAGVDAELDDMYKSYSDELSAYYVVEVAGEIQGVGGYAPLAGTAAGSIVELRKMYLKPTLRGLGLGQKLIDICIAESTDKGYKTMYLETVPDMKAAHGLYKKNGFEYLDNRMGNTGHSNCGVYMHRKLNA